MNTARSVFTIIGVWFVAACLLGLGWAFLRDIRLKLRCRCSICRQPSAIRYRSRMGDLCEACYDVVFRLYHYRRRLTSEEAERIFENLWRDVDGYEFDGDGWSNG